MQTLSALVLCGLVTACGGGDSGTGSDLTAIDLGTKDLGGDTGSPTDVPQFQDVIDPGSDTPETDPGADLPDTGDPGLDTGDPGDEGKDAGDSGDPGEDTGSDVEVIECKEDSECEGKVGTLGACEFPECADGLCRKGVLPDQTPCSDGDPCTESGECLLGICNGMPVQCDDGKVCTVDSCLPGTGCQYAPITGPCTDEDACTKDEQCVEGNCTGTAVDCSDDNPCTIDTCDTLEGCQYEDILSGDCDDGSVCTENEQCVEGDCVGFVVDCDDSNLCTTDTCDPADGCQYQAAAGKCDDGLDCTEDDACADSACEGIAIDCDDGDPCSDDSCEEGAGCVHNPNQAPCDDLNPCTKEDVCKEGACAGTAVICDQPPVNACLDDWTAVSYAAVGICDATGVCDYLPQELDCTPENCADGACPGDPCEGVDCSEPPGPCFAEGTCSDGSCSYPYADGAECDDINPCTYDDACDTGVCSGVPVLCNDPPPDECQDATTLMVHQIEGACDGETGLCDYLWEPLLCANGCADGVCIETLGLLQAELTAAGILGLTSGNYGMSCVLPGWYEGGTMGSTIYVLDAGFEP